MDYQNRLPEEGINTPGRHPLVDFLRLSVFAVIALLVFGLLLNAAGGRLGGLIPFRVELWIADQIDDAFIETGADSPFNINERDSALNQYLNRLSDQIQQSLGMKEPMSIRLHYSNADTFNAFATIGGHVYLYKGLLQVLPHENALVMLMAHEFSHVQLRHTVRGVGGGLAVAVGASLLPGGGGVESRLYSLAGRFSNLSFSREMETEADLNALGAVNQMYGHVNGAGDLFALFIKQRQGVDSAGRLEGFFSTHPLDAQRIEELQQEALAQGMSLEGVLTPLPDKFEVWLNAGE